jgi:hypothetical protein
MSPVIAALLLQVVSGTVTFGGERPAKDRADLVVGRDGGLQWAFVCVTKGLEGRTFEAPTELVTLEARDLRFQPRVLGVRAGQPIVLRNTEDITRSY